MCRWYNKILITLANTIINYRGILKFLVILNIFSVLNPERKSEIFLLPTIKVVISLHTIIMGKIISSLIKLFFRATIKG